MCICRERREGHSGEKKNKNAAVATDRDQGKYRLVNLRFLTQTANTDVSVRQNAGKVGNPLVLLEVEQKSLSDFCRSTGLNSNNPAHGRKPAMQTARRQRQGSWTFLVQSQKWR